MPQRSSLFVLPLFIAAIFLPRALAQQRQCVKPINKDKCPTAMNYIGGITCQTCYNFCNNRFQSCGPVFNGVCDGTLVTGCTVEDKAPSAFSATWVIQPPAPRPAPVARPVARPAPAPVVRPTASAFRPAQAPVPRPVARPVALPVPRPVPAPVRLPARTQQQSVTACVRRADGTEDCEEVEGVTSSISSLEEAAPEEDATNSGSASFAAAFGVATIMALLTTFALLLL